MHKIPPIRSRQSGAVLVETAITIPVFLLMVVMVMELGIMLRDYTALRGTALEAVRSAAIAGDDFNADHRVLEVIEDVSSPLPAGTLKLIVIFKADSYDSKVPTSCLTASQNTTTVRCNRYLASDLIQTEDKFGCDEVSDLDQAWCPSDRVVIQSPSNGGPPDYVGVHLEIERRTLTGIIAAQQTLRKTDVLRIEPRDQ